MYLRWRYDAAAARHWTKMPPPDQLPWETGNTMRAYPSVQQLKCLLAVTELLNFRSAAERLNLSQPPLSRHIKALRDWLACDSSSATPIPSCRPRPEPFWPGRLVRFWRRWISRSMPRRRRANARPRAFGLAS